MARKFKLLGRDVIIGKRVFGVGKEEQSIGVANLLGGDPKAFSRLDSYQGLVYACINRIAETYATYDPYIEEKRGDQWEAIDDHDFLRLLRNPSGTEDNAVPLSRYDILFATAAFILLQGDAYWYMPIGKMTKQPKEIILLRADRVGKEYDENGNISTFFVRTYDNKKIYIPTYEMLPFIGFDPKNPYQGLGKTEASKEYIETDAYSNQFTSNFFKNNAGISGVLTFKGQIEKSAFKKAVRAWREKYQGVDNAGKVMMVRDSDASFVKVGLGLNELDMSSLRDMSREDIAIMYGVPLPLLGKTDQTGLGRANIEALEYIFAKYTINPMMIRLDNILQFAINRYYSTNWMTGAAENELRIKHMNIIPEDKEYELRSREVGVDKWLTRNEVRAQDKLEDVDGGDQLFVPFNNIPINEASYADAAPAASGKGLTIKVTRKAKTAKKKDQSVAKENFRVQLMRNQVRYERVYKKKMKPVLLEQRKEALNNLEAHAASYETKAVQELFNIGDAVSAFEKALIPTLITLGEDQGGLALLFAGDDEHEFRMTAQYEKLLRNSTRRMAQRYNEDTLEKLNETLAVGIQNGEALSDLKNRVESVYDYAESYRAERVARTETLKASNNATQEAYEQTGFVVGKEWYVNPGACEQCEAFDGKEVGLSETFVKQGQSYTYTDSNGDEQTIENTYDDVDNPPLHPNCRCTIIPIR